MAVNTNNPNQVGLHRWVQDRLSAYIDDELSVSEKGLVEGHLSECAQCADDLRMLRQTVGWVRALPVRPVPRPFTIAVEAPVSSRFTLGWLYPYLKASAAAAAMLLIITLCVDVVRLAPTGMRLVQAPMGAPAAPAALMTAYPTAATAEQASAPAVERTSAMASPEGVAEETRAPQPSKSEAKPAGTALEANAGLSPSAEGEVLILRAGQDDEGGQIAAAPPAPAVVKPQAEGLGAAPLAAPAEETPVMAAPAPMLRQAAPPILPQAKPPRTEGPLDAAATATTSSGTAWPSPPVAPGQVSPPTTATQPMPEQDAVP